IDTRNVPDPVAAIVATAAEEGARGLVLGLPLHPDGRPSEKTAAVRRFAAALSTRCALPLFLQDETWSTVEAKERTAHWSAKRKKNEKSALDSAAAAVILQRFFETPEGGRVRFAPEGNPTDERRNP
ncbi:MAG: Holliday junction resolvase RuvX, partial [Fibrobacterales bacterium]|nr:Holliday junction resolvase RuvX [Fibrobacterales bacterium]